MKTTLFVTAASVLILSACAGMQGSNGAPHASPSAATGTMYCWKRSLEEAGSTLVCNWEATTRDACKSIAQVPLSKATVASGPRDAGRCDNGEWLVAVSTK